MSAMPEPFKKGGGFVTTQGDCMHSGQWLGVIPEVLVDGSVVGGVDVAEKWLPIGPGGTLGLFLPLGTSDDYAKWHVHYYVVRRDSVHLHLQKFLLHEW